jgi:hypothetical protein
MLGVAVHVSNPSQHETETGGMQLKTSPCKKSVRPYLKKKKKKKLNLGSGGSSSNPSYLEG